MRFRFERDGIVQYDSVVLPFVDILRIPFTWFLRQKKKRLLAPSGIACIVLRFKQCTEAWYIGSRRQRPGTLPVTAR